MSNAFRYRIQDEAINAAASLADQNGSPVAVLLSGGVFQLVEDADEMDRLIDNEGWEQVAVLDPEYPTVHDAT